MRSSARAKTAMDTCQWLLWRGMKPADIASIRPRDAWLINRAIIQLGAEFADRTAAGIRAQNQAIMGAASIEDLFERLITSGWLLRLDDNVQPTVYRCAVVFADGVRTATPCVRNIVSTSGHVQHIERGKIILDRGTVPPIPGTLHIKLLCGWRGDAPGRTGVPRQSHHCAAREPVPAGIYASLSLLTSKSLIPTTLSGTNYVPRFLIRKPTLIGSELRCRTNRAYLQWSEDDHLQEWLDNARLKYHPVCPNCRWIRSLGRRHADKGGSPWEQLMRSWSACC